MSASQLALDGLVRALTDAAGGATVTLASAGAPGTAAPDGVVVTPLSLGRVGRSRRLGPLLDVELGVAVQAGGDDVLGLTERLLLAAEAVPHTRFEPLPADRAGFGFVVVLPASLSVPEPTAPPVRERVVQLQPLVTIRGTVVDPDGSAVPDVEVVSSLTSQRVRTDATGGFTLPGLSEPTTLTLTRGARRTVVEVPAEPTALRVVLPIHEGG